MIELSLRIQEAEKILADIKREIADVIDAGLSPQISGIDVKSTKPFVCVVMASSLNSWCQDEYNSEAQRDSILKMVEASDPIYAIRVLRELVDQRGKSSSKYLKDIHFHPEILRRIDLILQTVR